MIPDFFQKQIPTGSEERRRWFSENYEIISFKPPIEFRGVSEDEPLRRYVDLPKLFDLLAKKRLVLSNPRRFLEGDPFECSARRSYDHLDRPTLESRVRELQDLMPERIRKTGARPNPSGLLKPSWSPLDVWVQDLLPRMTIEQLRDVVSYLEKERLKRDVYCSCWHRDKGDSDAMWKIYAPQLGVSIISSTGRLKLAIQGLCAPKLHVQKTRLILASIEYDDADDLGDREPWLIKRRAFAHEEEVRLCCDAPFASGTLELEVDLLMLIKEIVITPFASRWQVGGIKAAIEALLRQAGTADVKVPTPLLTELGNNVAA